MQIRRKPNFQSSKRLEKKNALFQILSGQPDLTASQLQQRAGECGLKLTRISAYRALKAFRDSEGRLENTEGPCVRTVSLILQEAGENELLSAEDICARAAQKNFQVHQSTIYRVLKTLCAVGLVRGANQGRQKLFQWKRGDERQFGNLCCVVCGRSLEFTQDNLGELAGEVCARLGYEFYRVELNVRSLCENCR